LRLFVTDHPSNHEAGDNFRIWINPRIISGQEETFYEEGCLSFPGIYAKVLRAKAIDVTWQDLTGAPHHGRFDYGTGDFLAIVIQHELDHLEGILFVDHLSSAQLDMIRRRLRELEQAHRDRTGTRGTVLRR
jgi:peptide deformylase